MTDTDIYQSFVSQLKTDLIMTDPTLEEVLNLPSEPLVKLIEAVAYRLLDMQLKINNLS